MVSHKTERSEEGEIDQKTTTLVGESDSNVMLGFNETPHKAKYSHSGPNLLYRARTLRFVKRIIFAICKAQADLEAS